MPPSSRPCLPDTSPPLLVLEAIRLERGGRCLLAGLTLTLAPGEALTLTGANGSGKSSLLRLVAGLCPPAKGRLSREADIAWLGPEDALKPGLTVEANLRLFSLDDIAGIHHALQRVGLSHLLDCPARLLSLGQRRRVAIARLLLTRAPLWLLDEPANALDAGSLRLLASLMAEHRAAGGALVVASHTSLSLPGGRHLQLSPGRSCHGPVHPPPPRRMEAAPHAPAANLPRAAGRATGRHPFLAHLRRELRLAGHERTESLAGLCFLCLCSTLFPLALGPSPRLLQQAGPGILWVCTLLASLLPLERLYRADAEDGSLDLLHVTLHPALIALGKIIIHWLSGSLPVLLAVPLLGLAFQLPPRELPVLLASLTLGSLTLALIGGMTAAITLGARRTTLLLPLLTLPLMTPALIFGTLACTSRDTAALHANLSLQGALLLLALPFCPLIAGTGLREACR